MIKRSLLGILLVIGFTTIAVSQTTLNGGEVTGPLTKAKSPYLVTETIEVPKGKTLVVEPGVRLEFAGHVNLNVYGSIQARGTKQDSIVFTAIDTSDGWKGIQVFKNQISADSNLFEYCEFSHTYQIDRNWRTDFGAFLLDTVDNIRFSHCLFTRNIAFVGGCLFAKHSQVSFNHCGFVSNQALDTGTNSPPGADGPFSSCIQSTNSWVNLTNCSFIKNTSTAPWYDNDHIPGEEEAYSMLYFNGKKVNIINCVFERNHVDTDGMIVYRGNVQSPSKNDSFLIENCQFIKNTIRSGPILRLDGEQKQDMRFFVRHCDFIENRSLVRAKGDVIFCYNNNGGSNDMIIDHCRLINNSMHNGVYSSQGTDLKLSNTIIAGQEGFAFTNRRSSRAHVVNCLLVNNWVGIELGYNGESNIVNSLIAFNGRIDTTLPYPEFPNDKPFYTSNGIYVSDRGKVNLYNCIITNNRGHLGQMANIVGINRSLFAGNLHNCILEGGVDSTYRQGIGPLWTTTGNMPFSSEINVNINAPDFVQPPKGIGVKYFSESNDYHINQTCDTSAIFNQGDRFPSIPYDFYPNSLDYDGLARYSCGQIDIGPFEEIGPKGYTYLENPWNDTTLCSDYLSGFNPKVCGHQVDYQWQFSKDGSNWTNLQQGDFDNNKLTKPQVGYYQIFTHQKECDVRDTFGPAELKINPSPKPWLGNDTILYNNDTLRLSPGEFASYQWNTPPPNKEKEVFISGYKYRNSKSKIFWCEVTSDSGCTKRDSILIYFHDWTASTVSLELVEIKVFPNPMSDKLVFQLQEPVNDVLDIVLSNQLGQVIRQHSFAKGEQMNEWDITHLPKGNYYLQLSYQGKTQTRKLVKSKEH